MRVAIACVVVSSLLLFACKGAPTGGDGDPSSSQTYDKELDDWLDNWNPATSSLDGQFEFREVRVAGLVPARSGAGGLEPVCEASTTPPDGILLDLVLAGEHTKSGVTGAFLPGSLLKSGTLAESSVTADLFTAAIDCILPYRTGATCELSYLTLTPEEIEFREAAPAKAKTAVAILLDMSGSMNGLTYPHSPYNEDSPDVVSNWASNASDMATDLYNSRYGAVEELLLTLPASTVAIVLGFNESGIRVVCEYLPGGDESISNLDKLKRCLSTDRGLVLSVPIDESKSPLDALKGTEQGRTPLWSALEMTWEYMSGLTDESKAAGVLDYPNRHIIIIGDGPDTCSRPNQPETQDGLCAAFQTPFETVLEMISQTPAADRIPVHFVQMAAKGYPTPDPLQQEVACLTRGHYVFLAPKDSDTVYPALSRALETLRMSLDGTWRLAASLPANADWSGLATGLLAAVAGHGEMASVPGLSTGDTALEFGQVILNAETTGVEEYPMRLACSPSDPEACPGTTPINECTTEVYSCDSQTQTCSNHVDFLPAGEADGPCEPQDVYIALETHTAVGDSMHLHVYLFKLYDVETRCCHGECMPPAPPKVPEEVAKPQNLASACFWYDDAKGWVKTNPASFDKELVECVSASDCGYGFACKSNTCVMTCIFQSDCSDAVGDGYDCQPDSLCAKKCQTDADCPIAWECSNGHCAQVVCAGDGDCPEKYLCEEGSCEYDLHNEDDVAWVYFADLHVKEGCQIEDFEPYLSSYGEEPFGDEGWEYCWE